MIMNNRKIDDDLLDDVDHALGRPNDPLEKSYRDYYMLGANTEQAAAMVRSGYFRCGSTLNDGRDIYLHVTDAGRKALSQALQARAAEAR